MIMRLLNIALIGAVLLFNMTISSAFADTEVNPAGTVTSGPDDGLRGGSGTCDWSEYKESLFGTESKGSGGYIAVNSICATGKYQFMPGTAAGLTSYQQNASRCNINTCRSGTGLATNECGDVQEAMMDEFTTQNLKALQQKDCWNKIGTQVTGYKCTKSGIQTKTCTVTASGILAGAHIGGSTGVCNTLNSGRDVDDGGGCKTNGRSGTSRLYYVCAHASKQVPEADCTPQDYPTYDAPQSYPDLTEPLGPARTGLSSNQEKEDGPQSVQYNLGDELKNIWVATLQMMTSQFTATMMQQVQAIGMFFDAKHQLEVQRDFQALTAQAHKDYHPSTQMCEVGTFVRHLTQSEKQADLSQAALSNRMLSREVIAGEAVTVEADVSDYESRLKQFKKVFCNPKDAGGGMKYVCKDADEDPLRMNRDIDFTQTVSLPMTLDIDFLKDGTTPQEEDVMALLSNLFYHEPFPPIPPAQATLRRMIGPMQNMRSVIAMRGIARNSISNIIAEKTPGPEDGTAMPFIRALIKEFGLEEEEIFKTFGENPSYHAQMEILTKTLYQHPDFIVNLYDKPANVKRIRAAMRAIKLMQDRDIHDAMMRREMILSMILELRIRKYQRLMVNEMKRKRAQNADTIDP